MVFNTGSPRESVFLKRNFCSVPISLQKDFSLNNSRTMAPLNSPAYVCQGSTLRVNLWPQASKNSQKQHRASKKRPQLVLQGQ